MLERTTQDWGGLMKELHEESFYTNTSILIQLFDDYYEN